MFNPSFPFFNYLTTSLKYEHCLFRFELLSPIHWYSEPILISEIAVIVVVGVDHNLLYHNLRINHNELQSVLARGDVERRIEPSLKRTNCSAATAVAATQSINKKTILFMKSILKNPLQDFIANLMKFIVFIQKLICKFKRQASTIFEHSQANY